MESTRGCSDLMQSSSISFPHALQFLGGLLGPLGSRNRNPRLLFEMQGKPSEMSQDEIVSPRRSWGSENPGDG